MFENIGSSQHFRSSGRRIAAYIRQSRRHKITHLFYRRGSNHLRLLRFKHQLMISFLVYLLCSAATSLRPDGRDYPFFSGRWFYSVPFRMSDYSLLVKELDGKHLDPPTFIEKMYPKLPGVWPYEVYGSIQEWGRALSQKSPRNELLKSAAIRSALSGHSFKACLVRRKMDPIQFVKSAQVEISTPLEEIDSP